MAEEKNAVKEHLPVSFKKLCRRMKATNVLLHFFRKNHVFKNYYYNEFIRIIGYDNWQQVKPAIRNAWDCASGDFDKLLGLLCSFKNFTTLDEMLAQEKKEEKQKKKFLSVAEDTAKILDFFFEYQKKHKLTGLDYEYIIKISNLLAGNELEGKELEIKKLCIDYLKGKKELADKNDSAKPENGDEQTEENTSKSKSIRFNGEVKI